MKTNTFNPGTRGLKFLAVIGFLLFSFLAFQSAFASTDYMFFWVNGDTSGNSMIQGDSVGWGSNCDIGATLTWEIWLDLNSNSAIDSLIDRLVTSYTIADGQNSPNQGLPDINPTPDGWYITPHMMLGIAVGQYIFKVTNHTDNSTVQDIVVCSPMATPPNKFRGHISIQGHPAPDSIHLRNIWVEANLDAGMQLWSGLTNDSGFYEINVGDGGTGLEFSIKPGDISGYVTPASQLMTALGIIDNIDFEFAAPTDSIYGQIVDEHQSLITMPVNVYCQPRFSGPGNKECTATDGSYKIYFAPSEYGLWSIGLEQADLAPAYLVPIGFEFDNQSIHSMSHDFVCYIADTVIYARVTENSGHPSHPYMIQTQSILLQCATNAVSDTGAANLVTIHISSLDLSSWSVTIANWDSRYPIPDGYVLNGNSTMNRHPGDTVALNLISGKMVKDTITLDPGDAPVNWGNVWVNLNKEGSSYGANPDNNGVFTVYADTGTYSMNVNYFGYLASPFTRTVQITDDTIGGLGFILNKAHCRVTGTLINVPTPFINPVYITAHTGTGNSGYQTMVTANSQTGVYTIELCDGNWTIDPPFFQNRIAPQAPTFTISEIPDTARTVNLVYTVLDINDHDQLPTEFDLLQNYPNPFNSATLIEFRLSTRSHVKITIINLLGETVRTLVDQDNPMGIYRVIWDGTDGAGNSVSTGLYMYRIQAGNAVQTKKMLLLR